MLVESEKESESMIEEAVNIERRTFMRLPREAEVKYYKLEYPLEDKGMEAARMKNAGSGGLLFEADRMIDVGTVLRVDVTPPNRHECRPGENKVDEDSITIIVEVVRSLEIIPEEKYDIGVKFIDIYEDDLGRLLIFLEMDLL